MSFVVTSPVGMVSSEHLGIYQVRALKTNLTSPAEKIYCLRLNLPVEGVPRYDYRGPFSISLCKAGEAVGVKIDCMDGSFEVSDWCLHHSDLLLRFYKGKIKRKLLVDACTI